MREEEPRIKAFVTKYALTAGIQEVDARICIRTSDDMIAYTIDGGFEQTAHVEGRDWHRTREAAVKRAEQMRAAKLTSISKQAKRLEALKF